jgi:hypothetical protein
VRHVAGGGSGEAGVPLALGPPLACPRPRSAQCTPATRPRPKSSSAIAGITATYAPPAALYVHRAPSRDQHQQDRRPGAAALAVAIKDAPDRSSDDRQIPHSAIASITATNVPPARLSSRRFAPLIDPPPAHDRDLHAPPSPKGQDRRHGATALAVAIKDAPDRRSDVRLTLSPLTYLSTYPPAF